MDACPLFEFVGADVDILSFGGGALQMSGAFSSASGVGVQVRGMQVEAGALMRRWPFSSLAALGVFHSLQALS